MLNHPTGLFSEDYNSALGSAGPSNIYTPYNSRICISSRTWGTGRPHVGLCPIFLVLVYFLTRHRISELRRPIAAKHCTVIRICVIFLMHVKNLGESSSKKFGRPKTCKIWTNFSQLSNLIANISGTRQDFKNRKDI